MKITIADLTDGPVALTEAEMDRVTGGRSKGQYWFTDVTPGDYVVTEPVSTASRTDTLGPLFDRAWWKR